MPFVRSVVAVAVAAISVFSSLSQAAPSAAISAIEGRSKFPFHTEKVRGVNLGGWFVLEPWITPSIFEKLDPHVVDEHSLTRTLGKEAAHKLLEHHWKTWIKRDDFFDMASKGLNFVRIPIGYWSVIDRAQDPYVKGAYKHLAQALDWADEAGLKVMIDLHGAPRSQNGFDNSGKRGPIGWQKSGSEALTRKVLNKIKKDHAHHPAVATIEILNEPYGPSLDLKKIKHFYEQMNHDFQGHNIATTFHDAFEGVTSWNKFGKKGKNWVLDTHHYEVFTSDDLSLDTPSHVGYACYFGSQMASNNKVTIAGEWTGAMTDCTKWLNGRGYGARYDGTYHKGDQTSYYIGSCKGLKKGTVNGLSDDQKTSVGQFIEAQMDAYEEAGGWIFWTWKTESSPEWDFQALANHGIVPQPITSRKYPGQCG